jgi:signal transduction histidine kinase
MGLGLYIVKTIIKLHGGEITVSSVQYEYCRFEFWIPKLIEKPKSAEELPPSAEKIERKGK